MLVGRVIASVFVALFFAISSTTESLAGTQLYQGWWISESFGNDKAGIGTKSSAYFEVLGIPQGRPCHPNAPLCHMKSTPVTTQGCTPTVTGVPCPGPNGTAWNPIGPGCRPLATTETPRPAKNGTLTTGGSLCAGPLTPIRPHTRKGTTTTVGVEAQPCNKKPPLYRNPVFFTPGGAPDKQTCTDQQTVGHYPGCTNCKTTAYLAPNDPQHGKGMKGAPLWGTGYATTTGSSFKFPAAPATKTGAFQGMRRTTHGSFIGEGPYVYSYTYANLRNDAGTFGPGQGFFSAAAPTTTLTWTHNQGGQVALIKVNRRAGSNAFGGVMKLLGTYRNKVCYYYGGGCALGIGTWGYQDIGTPGYKNAKTGSKVITAPWTTQFKQVYYNTAAGTNAKYTVIEERFPWTTGTVTVTATGRGPAKTYMKRKGFDNRTATSGLGTVQLVSPLLTQWLGSAAAQKFETGGIAVMQIRFIPEPGGFVSLIAGILGLWVLHRVRR
jgi:hypothetical protein